LITKKIKMNLQVIFYIVFIALTVLRFYMEYYLGWDLGLNSKVDDEMQVNNAYSILHGQWMGEYSNSTIPKHPMFPILLAMIHSFVRILPNSYDTRNKQTVFVLQKKASPLAFPNKMYPHNNGRKILDTEKLGLA